MPVTRSYTSAQVARSRSLPYAVRFRQCIVEYLFPTNESKRPLYNAIKYATSFPVIYLSAAQRLADADKFASQGDMAARHWYNEHMLYKLWCVRVLSGWRTFADLLRM